MKFQVRPRAPVTRAITLGDENATIIQNNYIQIPKNILTDHQIRNETSKNHHRPKKRKKKYHIPYPRKEILHLRSTLSKHFKHLPFPSRSPHNIPSNDDSRDETSKNDHRPKKKRKKVSHSLSSQGDHPPSSIDSFKHFRTSPTSLDPLTTFSLVRTPTRATFPNFLTFHLFDEKNDSTQLDPTLDPRTGLSNQTINRVTRAEHRPVVSRRRNLAGLPGYQVDSEAESPGRRVHLRGCKARGSVGNRHRRAAASVRVFA